MDASSLILGAAIGASFMMGCEYFGGVVRRIKRYRRDASLQEADGYRSRPVKLRGEKDKLEISMTVDQKALIQRRAAESGHFVSDWARAALLLMAGGLPHEIILTCNEIMFNRDNKASTHQDNRQKTQYPHAPSQRHPPIIGSSIP